MLAVLGLDPLSDQWVDQSGQDARLHGALDQLVQDQLRRREQARADKDFATADSIRDSLAAAGVAIEDTAEGPRWSLAEEA